MITEWLFSIAQAFGVGVLGAMPRFSELDGVVVTAGTFVLPLADGLASLGAWINWPAVAVMLPLTFGVYLVTFVLRLVRAVAGHIPFIGGNG